MLVVSTYIEKSDIDGLGLFAGQDIEKGDIIWFLDPSVDHVFSNEEFENMKTTLSSENRERFMKWSFTRKNGSIILPADNAKFENHSNNPNQICNGKYDLASRKILKGEEITCDYRQFEDKPNEVEKKAYEQGNEKIGEKVGKT